MIVVIVAHRDKGAIKAARHSSRPRPPMKYVKIPNGLPLPYTVPYKLHKKLNFFISVYMCIISDFPEVKLCPHTSTNCRISNVFADLQAHLVRSLLVSNVGVCKFVRIHTKGGLSEVYKRSEFCMRCESCCILIRFSLAHPLTSYQPFATPTR